MNATALTRVVGSVAVALLLTACGRSAPEPSAANVAGNAQPTLHWKLVTTWPKNLPALGTAPEHLADKVRVMSGGRLDIKVYGADELVPADGVFDAVSQGSAEMGHGAAYYWRNKAPIAVLFATVPFGLNAQEMNAWLHYGGGLALWRELYGKFDLVPFACGNSGVQMAGWFNKEINSVADLKGLTMRIPGMGGEVLKRAGGTPVTLPGGDIFTAMQTGSIDATEWVGPYNDLALGLYNVAKYYYYPGWHEPGPTLELIINKKAWDSLSPDLQAIVETASRAVNQDMLDEFTARNNTALRTLVDDHKVQLRRLPEDVLAKFKSASEEVLKESAGNDELAQRVLASYLKFRRDVWAYHEISEKAYYDLRGPSPAN